MQEKPKKKSEKTEIKLRVFLVLFVIDCFALLPAARAVCQEGCDVSNNKTFLGFDTLFNGVAVLPAGATKSKAANPTQSRGAFRGAFAATAASADLTSQNFVRFPSVAYPLDDTAIQQEEDANRVLPPERMQSRDLPHTPAPLLGPLDGRLLGYDPQVAAGDHYVAVIEAHSLSFYDKSGVALPDLSGSGAYAISSYELFQRFLAPKNKDATVNQENMNLFAGYPPNPKLPCDLTNTSAQQGCINEVYDLRVAYDATHKRFIFVGNARNSIWGCADYAAADCYPYPYNKNLCSDAACRLALAKLARRYTVFAISKTEDPRQGFHTYWLPTAGDWPSIAVNGSRLLITENSICGKPQPNLACQKPKPSDYPEIYIVSTDDIATGSSHPSVHWYLTDTDMSYAYGLRPVVSHDPAGPDYFVAPDNGSLRVWASTDPTKPLVTASIDLQEIGMIRGSVVLQSGRIYCTYASGTWCKTLKPVPPDCPLTARLIGIDVKLTGNKLTLTKALDFSFGHNGPGDDPSDLVSYEMPSLEVTKNGDVVIAYIRRPVKTLKTLFNEVRYSV
jgi:hypothetical protein